MKVTAVVYILTSMIGINEGDSTNQFLKNNFANLNQSQDQWELFGILNFYWNFLDYHLLDHLINELCRTHHLFAVFADVEGEMLPQDLTIMQVKIQIKSYKMDVEQFKMITTLQSFYEAEKGSVSVGEPPQNFRTIVSQHRMNTQMTLAVVEEFCRRVVPQYSLGDCAMMLNRVLLLPQPFAFNMFF